MFRRKWYNERRQGPFEVVRSTGTAVQVKGSSTWYHLSHCVKAQDDRGPDVWYPDAEGSSEPGTRTEEPDGQRNPESPDQLEDLHENVVGSPADTGYISSAYPRGEVDSVDFQGAPDAAGPNLLRRVSPRTRERSRTREARAVQTSSPRPIRQRVPPRRYEA